MDVSLLSLRELKELSLVLPREIERRTLEEKQSVKKDLEALAAERGFSLEELFSETNKKSTRGKVSPKYRHPGTPTLQWTGRGRQPKWIAAWIAEGKTLAELEI